LQYFVDQQVTWVSSFVAMTVSRVWADNIISLLSFGKINRFL